MRSIAVLFVFTLFLFPQLQAQRTYYAILKGIVVDSSSLQPLEAATVSVFLVADSSLVTYCLTNKKGEFLIKEIPQSKPCRVLVSYSGFSSFARDFIISSDKRELIINTVRLKKDYAEMEEVIVSAQRPPFLVKKDTLEFNAGAFKTSPNGVLEDLLKQLPGVEVDASGNITVNGKRVTKITVNGKDFFGDDFKITSKNLPKYIIDKIQVVDFNSFEDKFHQKATGSTDKTINLLLKKEASKGVFGRVNSGYGLAKRYESGASLNYFNGPLQLSFLGNVNNTNRTGFTGEDIASEFAGGENGITKTKAGGINFSKEVGKRLQIGGSYLFKNTHLTNAVTIQRQNILPDTTFVYISDSRIANNNTEHRINMNFRYQPDSLTELRIRGFHKIAPAASLTNHEARSTSAWGELINKGSNQVTGNSNTKFTDILFFFGHRFIKSARAITLKLNFISGALNSTEKNFGEMVFYNKDGSYSLDTTDQHGNTFTLNDNFTITASWTEPILNKLSMNLGYTYKHGLGKSSKITNKWNPITGEYDERDTLFSNTFDTKQRSHAPNLSIMYQGVRGNVMVGASMQWLEQENVSLVPKQVFRQNFVNIFPSVSLNYQIDKTSNLRLDYNGHTQQPSLDQLQPVRDNRNTLFLRLGNPDLKPSFMHNIGISIQRYKGKSYWNGGLHYSLIKNQIVDEIWFDTVQISRPINANGNFSLSSYFSFSKEWKKNIWSLRLTFTTQGGLRRNISLSNKIENVTRHLNIMQRIGIIYSYKDFITLIPIFSIRYNVAKYSIAQQPNENIQNDLFMNVFVKFTKRCTLENQLQYLYNGRTAPGFQKRITMWHIAANYELLKNQRMILRLSAYDLLNQNTSINRRIEPFYIEDTRILVLQQYFLLSFIYNLNKDGK